MDNLYISSNISLYAINYKSKVYIHGVTRQSVRGLPKCIDQTLHTIKDDVVRHSGTLKVEKLVCDPTIKYLVETSLCGLKPLYSMTNDWTEIRSIQEHREVWSSCLQRMTKIPYYRLNVMDIYNHNMNNVDISDQLRVVYWWYNWMIKRN